MKLDAGGTSKLLLGVVAVDIRSGYIMVGASSLLMFAIVVGLHVRPHRTVSSSRLYQ